MRRLRVTVFDSRPRAWEKCDAAADDDSVRAELRQWLKGELDQADAVVVKDPRVGWFLPLWTGCASDLGAPASFVCMLRHPAEILASARKWYGDWQNDASRAAAWLNVMLETERKTREMPRAFVRYEDLLADWERELRRAGEALGDPLLTGIDALALPAGGRVRGPDACTAQRRGWEDLDVPARVRELAERVWGELQPLADEGGDGAEVRGDARQLARGVRRAVRGRRRRSRSRR